MVLRNGTPTHSQILIIISVQLGARIVASITLKSGSDEVDVKRSAVGRVNITGDVELGDKLGKSGYTSSTWV